MSGGRRFGDLIELRHSLNEIRDEPGRPGKRDQSREPAVESILVPIGFTSHDKSFVVQILFTVQNAQN
jgi:hypothetical protein